MRSVLVTGGAGFIGAHCCKALAAAGFAPIVFDNLSTGHRDFVQWGPLVVGDIRDESALIDAMRHHDVSAVVHLAALSLVGDSMRRPGAYFDVNVKGSLSLIAAMRTVGLDRLIFSSTGAVYGNVDGEMLITESQTCQPINPYGLSKHMCERMLDAMRHTGEMRSFALRYFNASGADAEGEIGERRVDETHLIPLAMDALLSGKEDFAVFGDDYATRDGTAVRDYIHVADLANAHVAALHALLDGAAGSVLNLGTSHGFTVLEILAAIENESGRSVPFRKLPRRIGDPTSLVAHAQAAQAVLNYRPVQSDLQHIVKTAWRWRLKEQASRNRLGRVAS